VAYVSANQVKGNGVLQKLYVMTRGGEHLSINSSLMSNFQYQIKKRGIAEDASGTAILGLFLGGICKVYASFLCYCTPVHSLESRCSMYGIRTTEDNILRTIMCK